MIKRTIQTLTLALLIASNSQACPPEWVLIDDPVFGPYWASSIASPNGGSRYLARYGSHEGMYGFFEFTDRGLRLDRWHINCDQHPADCSRIIDDINNDRLPARPPAAVDGNPVGSEPWMPGTPKNPPKEDKETKKDSNGCPVANKKDKAASSEYAKKVIQKISRKK